MSAVGVVVVGATHPHPQSSSTSAMKNDGGDGDAVIKLELTGDPGGFVTNYQPPFNPEDHNLNVGFRLTKFGDIRGCKGLKPGNEELEILLNVFREDEGTTMTPSSSFFGEEPAVSRIERLGANILETSGLLCPIVDDPYLMGKIGWASLMSGLFSLGVTECASCRPILAVSNRMEETERRVVLPMIIRGFRDAAKATETAVKSVTIIANPWCLLGGSATAVAADHELVPPDGATLGDVIVLTKPLGTSVAVTLAQWMEIPERRGRILLTLTEEDVARAHRRAVDSMARTNRAAALLMRKYNAHAACDVAHNGILGHADCLANKQNAPVSFVIHNMPVIAKMNASSKVTGNSMPLLQGLMPEISGGLLVVLPREQAAAYCKELERTEFRQAWIVGIVENGDRTARVIDRPRVIEVPAKETGALW